jgi:hypothetical protein
VKEISSPDAYTRQASCRPQPLASLLSQPLWKYSRPFFTSSLSKIFGGKTTKWSGLLSAEDNPEQGQTEEISVQDEDVAT